MDGPAESENRLPSGGLDVDPFSLMWGGFAIFWLVSASGIWDIWSKQPNGGFGYFGIVWGTPFVLVGQYMIWGRFVYQRWKKKRTFYALTKRRALIVHRGFRGRTSSSAYFENLSMLDKQVRSDGIGSISFGGPVASEWQWGRGSPPRAPTFDDLDNADSVHQMVLRLQDEAKKSSREDTSRHG